MNAPYPSKLVTELRRGNVAAFVGSGFSVPSGAPSWDDVLGALFQDLEADGIDVADLRHRYERGEITAIDAPDLHRIVRNAHSMRNRVLELFEAPIVPSAYHHALVALRFDLLITTNWDRAIEAAYDQAAVGLHRIWKDAHLVYYNEKRAVQLIKAHGSIDDPDTIVFASAEYDRFTQDRPLIESFLEAVFCTRTVLFLGFSLRDPNIRRLLERITTHLTGLGREHYAVLYDPDSAVVAELGRFGIQVIALDTSADVGTATAGWLEGLVEHVTVTFLSNHDKATALNEALAEQVRSGLHRRVVRMRAALGILSNPRDADPLDPIYGSAEQDLLEVEMGERAREFLRADRTNEIRCIVHVNPVHQRLKGYQWRHLRRRFQAMLDFVQEFPSQIHLAHSPIPVDMNHVIFSDQMAYETFKRGEVVGYDRLVGRFNRWVVQSEADSFDEDFDGIRRLNSLLARALSIDISRDDWGLQLSTHLLKAALASTERSKYVLECDEEGRQIGQVSREVAHREGVLHKSVHLHLFDWSGDGGRILVQRRPRAAELYPGMIDVSVAGHPEVDDPATEVLRELDEELGIRVDRAALVHVYQRIREFGNDREVADVFAADVSDAAGLIAQKFTRDVDAIFWIPLANLDGDRSIPAVGCEVFASLRLPVEAELLPENFVPGALEEIQRVARAFGDAQTPAPAVDRH